METSVEGRSPGRPVGAGGIPDAVPLEQPSHFELVPHKLVYGGSALGHHEGQPVLVAGALPGERVDVEPLRQAKGVVHGRLLKVLAPSAERVQAPCPYFGRCGGCGYQHLAYSRQLEVKREILRETLRRIGRIDWPGEIITRSAEPWHYRNQIQLKVQRDPAGELALGFFEAESWRLVPIDACLISSSRLNELIRALNQPEWRSRLAPYRTLDLRVDHRDQDVMLLLTGRIDDRKEDRTEGLAQEFLTRLAGVVSVALAAESESDVQEARPRSRRSSFRAKPVAPKIYGKPHLSYQVGDFRYEISPGSFFQSSRFLLPELVEAVVGSEARAGSLALDLYAGVGLFTLPLARRFDAVMAVEENQTAAADLARNAAAHQLSNVRAIASPASEFLRRYALGRPERVVLDPPRAGAEGSVLGKLAELGPTRVHYVSCNPPTLARDLCYLLGHGYELESLVLFDLFPQTFHIETLAKLRRIPVTVRLAR